jgi:hypothetical protein
MDANANMLLQQQAHPFGAHPSITGRPKIVSPGTLEITGRPKIGSPGTLEHQADLPATGQPAMQCRHFRGGTAETSVAMSQPLVANLESIRPKCDQNSQRSVSHLPT